MLTIKVLTRIGNRQINMIGKTEDNIKLLTVKTRCYIITTSKNNGIDYRTCQDTVSIEHSIWLRILHSARERKASVMLCLLVLFSLSKLKYKNMKMELEKGGGISKGMCV